MTSRLTKPQERELLAQERVPQETYGSARARVQNTLVAKGLSEFTEGDGSVVLDGSFASQCRLTDAGRIWLVGYHREHP